MLSLAEMKSTEPRCRVISDAAAVEVPTAVPWITSKMLAESTAETRYSLIEAGICNGKGDHGVSVPLSCRQGTGEGEDPAVLLRGATSIPKHPSILPGAPATQASKPKQEKPPITQDVLLQDGEKADIPRSVSPVATHLYPHDGEVWHGGVVEVDAGVERALRSREDLGAAGRRRVVEHLAQGEDVDEFGGEPGTHRVI